MYLEIELILYSIQLIEILRKTKNKLQKMELIYIIYFSFHILELQTQLLFHLLLLMGEPIV